MKISENVRNYAAQQGLTEAETLATGMSEKAEDFLEEEADSCAKV